MRKIAVLTFGLLVLQAVSASAAPDVVSREMCSDGAGVRLVLTDMGDRIKVRVEVHRSPVGHSWRSCFAMAEWILTVSIMMMAK